MQDIIFNIGTSGDLFKTPLTKVDQNLISGVY